MLRLLFLWFIIKNVNNTNDKTVIPYGTDFRNLEARLTTLASKSENIIIVNPNIGIDEYNYDSYPLWEKNEKIFQNFRGSLNSYNILNNFGVLV
jgi:hypothetical protein